MTKLNPIPILYLKFFFFLHTNSLIDVFLNRTLFNIHTYMFFKCNKFCIQYIDLGWEDFQKGIYSCTVVPPGSFLDAICLNNAKLVTGHKALASLSIFYKNSLSSITERVKNSPDEKKISSLLTLHIVFFTLKVKVNPYCNIIFH